MKHKGTPTALLLLLWFATLGLAAVAVANLIKAAPGYAGENRLEASWLLNDTPHSPGFYDVELAEVLKRSITFPSVLRDGKRLINYEYANTPLFCVDAVFYAGRAMGLIWAMDRPAIHEHKLYGIIDVASEIFDECLKLIWEQSFTCKIADAKPQIGDGHDVIIERLITIQRSLRDSQRVKYKDLHCSFSESVTQTAQAKINSCKGLDVFESGSRHSPMSSDIND